MFWQKVSQGGLVLTATSTPSLMRRYEGNLENTSGTEKIDPISGAHLRDAPPTKGIPNKLKTA